MEQTTPSSVETPPAPPSGVSSGTTAPPPAGSRAERELLIRKALKKVYDPEIPMNIVDLGLIYGMDWKDDEHVTVRMTMTAPGCPVAGILAEEVKTAAESVPGVKEAVVDVVWDPPWSPDRMSDFAKRQFGYL
jgi:FeS assembly SUF system protein